MKKLAFLTTLTALLLGFCSVASAWEITYCEDRPYYRRERREHRRYRRHHRYNRNNYCSPRTTQVYYYSPRYGTVSYYSPYSTSYDSYTVRETMFLY